jgi:type VI secretion system protein ImpK
MRATAKRNTDAMAPNLDDRTVLVSPRPATPAPAWSDPAPVEANRQGAGLNSLIDAASVLFGAIIRLRTLAHHGDPGQLRHLLVNEVKAFEAAIEQQGYDRSTVMAARYCICASVDEAVMVTPWGGEGDWSARTLLSIFHNETWGGEKFFLILTRLMDASSRHKDLLEFIYLCLRLGFEGRYRVLDNGRAKLDMLVENLYATISPMRGEFDTALSGHWQVTARAERPLRAYVSPWWIALGTICAAVLIYWLFDAALTTRSDETLRRLKDVESVQGVR